MMQSESTEVKRKKVFIPAGMMPKEIRDKYGLSHSASYRAKKRFLRQKLHEETDHHRS